MLWHGYTTGTTLLYDWIVQRRQIFFWTHQYLWKVEPLRSSIKVFRYLIWWNKFLNTGVDSKKLFNIVGKFIKISLKGVCCVLTSECMLAHAVAWSKTIKNIHKVLFSSCTWEAHVRLTKKNEEKSSHLLKTTKSKHASKL